MGEETGGQLTQRWTPDIHFLGIKTHETGEVAGDQEPF